MQRIPRKAVLLSLLGVLLLAVLPGRPLGAQPLKGVVWAVPPSVEQAQDDLIRMHRAGVEAVRTGLVTDERLLALADTLGLRLFQELPLDYLPARLLADTLAHARRLLAEAWARSRNHPAARHFGLARRSDTADPAACAFFEALAALLPRDEGVQVYYVSAFPRADRCRDTVDFVLYDGHDALSSVPLPLPFGLATLGAPVDPGAAPGLRRPYSPEAQARFLETHLTALLDAGAGPVAVFVHRWRDAPAASPANPEPPDPYGRRYGLHDATGTPRPAFAVVAGLYTGRQRVFAFPAGQLPAPPVPWLPLTGWGLLALLALYYAQSPRARLMVPRYFLAHTFYGEALREGRDVLPLGSTLLLMAAATAVGMVTALVAETYRTSAAALALLHTLPPGLRAVATGLLLHPWMALLLTGSLYVLVLSLWASVIALTTRRRRLTPAQVFMLVAWPRWSFLLLMLAAMVTASLPAEARPLPLLLAVTLALMLGALIRTVIDYARITRPTPLLLATVILTHPLVLSLPLAALALSLFGPWLTFLGHLLGAR